MTQLIPYLFFKGQCREAMEFYRAVFGGELSFMESNDLPDGAEAPEGMQGMVMHASLSGGDASLMASDSLQASPETRKVELLLTGQDEARLRAIFAALAEGGTVKSPMKQEFWGDIFGGLTDRFGIDWMVTVTPSS